MIIKPGRTAQHPLKTGKTIIVRPWRGQVIVQSWPRKRGQPKQPWAKWNLQRMIISRWLQKRVHPLATTTMDAALKDFLATHTGVKGTAAIRLRDWITQVIYGRAWMITGPDGTVYHTATQVRDASDWLDALCPRPGGVLIRAPDGWTTTVNCAPGKVLMLLGEGDVPGACPAASVPSAQDAAGGYPQQYANLKPIAPTMEQTLDTQPLPYLDLSAISQTYWQVLSGTLRVYTPANEIATIPTASWSDGAAYLTITRSSGVDILVRHDDANNSYGVVIRDDAQRGSHPQLILARFDSGAGVVLQTASPSIPQDSATTIGLSIQGSAIEVTLNGATVMTQTDTTHPGPGSPAIRTEAAAGQVRITGISWST